MTNPSRENREGLGVSLRAKYYPSPAPLAQLCQKWACFIWGAREDQEPSEVLSPYTPGNLATEIGLLGPTLAILLVQVQEKSKSGEAAGKKAKIHPSQSLPSIHYAPSPPSITPPCHVLPSPLPPLSLTYPALVGGWIADDAGGKELAACYWA